MELTEQERIKIEAEENYRLKIRKRSETKRALFWLVFTVAACYVIYIAMAISRS